MSVEQYASIAPRDRVQYWVSEIITEAPVPLSEAENASCWTGTVGETPVCLLVESGPQRTSFVEMRVTARAVDFANRTGSVLICVLIDGGIDPGPELGSHLRRTHRLSGSIPHITIEVGRRTTLSRLRAAASDFSTAVTDEAESDIPHFSGDADAAEWTRRLVSLLPANSSQPAPTHTTAPEVAVPDEQPDPVDIVQHISDVLPANIGPVTAGLQTGFTSIHGYTVGFFSSTIFTDSGEISARDLTSSSRVLDFCDAFHLPFVAIIDSAGCAEDVTPAVLGRFIRSLAESSTPMVVLLTGRRGGIVGDLLTDRGLMPGEVIAWDSIHTGSSGLPPVFDRSIDPRTTSAELLASLMRWSTVDEPLPVRRRAVSPR